MGFYLFIKFAYTTKKSRHLFQWKKKISTNNAQEVDSQRKKQKHKTLNQEQ
jgi:hypothetical protein